MGFRQFLLRGLDNVRTEWPLVCLAWNLKRMPYCARSKKSGQEYCDFDQNPPLFSPKRLISFHIMKCGLLADSSPTGC